MENPSPARAQQRPRARSVARLLVLAVVAALSAAGATGCGTAGPDAHASRSHAPARPPRTLDDLPVGAASRVPWWQDGVLHVGGRTVATAYRDLGFAGGTTLVGRSSVDRGSRWFLVDGDSLVPLLSSPGPVRPVASADGSMLAWSEPVDGSTRHLVAYDVASGDVLGTRDVAVEPECCDGSGEAFVLGIDTDGRVVYDLLGVAAHLWAPGGADVAITGVPRSGLDPEPWPGGVLWQGSSRDLMRLPGVYATVDEGGAVHRVGTVETDQLGTWNADGTAYAYPGQADGASLLKEPMTDVWVEHLDTGARTRLVLPPDRRFDIVAWESPTSLVLQTRNDYGVPAPEGEPPGLVALVRCDATSGACERTDDEVSGNVVLPTAR